MMMMKDHIVTRPLLTGIFSAGGDRFLLGQNDMKKNAYFGLAAFSSFMLVSLIAPKIFGRSEMRELGENIMELAGGSAGVIILDKYVFNANINRSDTVPRIGVVVASQIVSEYIANSLP
jgi:hypothetical protein